MAVHTAPRTHSARRTLVSLLLIPMLSLAGLWVFIASITFGNVINNEHYNTATNTIGPSIIGLEQTLETEGALTLALLSADRQSPALRTQLLQAREATDTEASAARTTTASVRGLLGATGQARLSTLLADLARLPRIRPAVDSGADSPVTAFAAYNTIDSALYGFLGNSTPLADPTLSLMTQSGIAESRAADFTAGAAGLI